MPKLIQQCSQCKEAKVVESGTFIPCVPCADRRNMGLSVALGGLQPPVFCSEDCALLHIKEVHGPKVVPSGCTAHKGCILPEAHEGPHMMKTCGYDGCILAEGHTDKHLRAQDLPL